MTLKSLRLRLMHLTTRQVKIMDLHGSFNSILLAALASGELLNAANNLEQKEGTEFFLR